MVEKDYNSVEIFDVPWEVENQIMTEDMINANELNDENVITDH